MSSQPVDFRVADHPRTGFVITKTFVNTDLRYGSTDREGPTV
jgi:hypothetical protein